MEINGKVYRNLEGQVQYLTEKWDDLQNQIDEVRADLVHYIIVEELPTEDIDTFAVYLVGPKGTEPDTYYEEWVYVKKADESWTWEKLGDTASVDLSGYLEKDTSTTTYYQAYGKAADGTQQMYNVNVGVLSGALPMRRTNGNIAVPLAPSEDGDATSKKYVDDNFLQKATGASTYGQAYVKAADGTQTRYDISVAANAYSIPYRDSDGRVRTKDPVNSEDSVNLSYAGNHYLAKNTNSTSYGQVYGKATDGTQTMWNINGNPVSDSIPLRFAYGQIKLPNQTTYPPTDDDYAVSKRYVDAVVGQLLYLHDLEIIVTVDATNKLYVKAYLINDDPTPLTAFSRIDYKRIDVQWGAFGPSIYAAAAVAVTKLPDGFRQEEFDEPFIGFLYQYIDNGNLISGKTNSSMSTTITDSVISW